MAQYTMTIKQLFENDIEIFDFSYPFYNESLRKKFEEEFINYFYFDEIGFETVPKFKHFLKLKLNLIMPYWNKIYETQELNQRILDNYSVVETFTKNITGTNNEENTMTSNSNNTGNVTTKNLYKDTPKTKIDIDNLDIVTSITKDIGTNETITTNEGNGTTTVNNTEYETWTRTMDGNIGIQTDSDAIIKYWDSLRKVTNEIFEKELSILFMGVY